MATSKIDPEYRSVEFPSEDGLTITADFYASPLNRGLILLCHRSHCNRAEYRQTAPRLAKFGFSCLAIDQRSGMKVFGETNETAKRAKEKGLATGYLNAKIDIEAAIKYCFDLNGKKPIFLVGSSYSAALALICSVANQMVGAVIAFSPGEFLKGLSVQEEIRELRKPVFVTSSKSEIDDASKVVRLIEKAYLTQHLPTIDGFHGSKMLWKTVPGSEEYWKGFEKFLDKLADQIKIV